MKKTIAAARTVHSLTMVCRNPPENLEEHLSALHTRAVGVVQQAMKGYEENHGTLLSNYAPLRFLNTTKDLYKSFLIQGKLQRDHIKVQNYRRVKECADTEN